MMKTRARVMAQIDNKIDVKIVRDAEIPTGNSKKRKLNVKASVLVPSKKAGRGCGKKIVAVNPEMDETVSVNVQKQILDNATELKQVDSKSDVFLLMSADITKSESQQANTNGEKEQVSCNKRGEHKSRLLVASDSAAVTSKMRKRAKPGISSKLSNTIAHSISVKSECVEKETEPINEMKKGKKSLENIATMKSEKYLVPKRVATGKKFVGAHVSIAGASKLLSVCSGNSTFKLRI